MRDSALAKNQGFRNVCADLFCRRRISAIEKKNVARPIQRFGRSKGKGAVDLFRGSRNPRPLCAIKGELLTIHRKEVLAKEHAKMLEHVTQPAYDRVVFTDGLFALCYVDDIEHGD